MTILITVVRAKNILLTSILCVLIITSSNAQVDFEANAVVSHFLVPDGFDDVAIGDINNDGFVDVASSGLNGDGIFWHNNILGTGRFVNTKLVSTTSIRSSEIVLDDVDEDGDLDMIALSNGRDTVSWLENIDGLGNFGPRKIINSTVDEPSTISTVDLDNDGRKDLLFTDGDGNVYLYRKIGGTDIYDAPIIISNNFFDGAFLTTSDIDGDSNTDLLLTDVRGDKIFWAKNLGVDLTFESWVLIDDEPRNPTITHADDLDNDGDADLIVYSDSDSELYWYENLDGLGNFGALTQIGGVIISAYDIKTADINQDGLIDIVVSHTVGDKVSIYTRIDANQVFEEVILSDELRFARALSIVDVDLDNDMDIIATSSNDNQMYWFDNLLGDWQFEQKPIASHLLENPRDLEMYDVDRDGDLDMVTGSLKGSQSSTRVIWYENVDGNGSFLTEQDLFFEDGLRLENILPLDVDNDGDTDILTTSSNKLSWHRNNTSTGEFEEQILNDEFSSISVKSIDYDMDGDLDIVATLGDNAVEMKLLWLFTNQDGLGNFDQGVEIANINDLGRFLELQILDFDNDGDEDIIVGETFGSFICYENIPGQGFTEKILANTDFSMMDYAVGDFDLDGDFDFVSIYAFNNEIQVHKDVDGTSTNYEQIVLDDNFEDSNSISVGDIDGDGDLDILASSSSSNILSWYENSNADAVFFPVASVGSFPASFIINGVADVDRNGSFDPIVYNSSLGAISWFSSNGRSSSSIIGFVRLDAQENGCSEGGVALGGIQVTSETDSDMLSSYSLQNGFYRILTNEGAYQTSITQSDIDYYIPNESEIPSTFLDSITVDTVDFCLVKTGDFYDLRLSIIPIDQTRPGFETNYEVVVQNIGTLPLGGEVCIAYDEIQLNLLASIDSLLFENEDSLVFAIDTLEVYSSSNNILKFLVSIPQLIDLGKPVCISGTVKPDTTDQNFDDNYFKLNDPLVNSFDPNDILVLEGSEILEEQVENYLHYIIRFQNTGTADAINVRLENELDDNLDHTTLQIISSSHDVRTTITDGTMAQFIFDGIYLPDSTANEALSHGYVSYRIKPQPDLVVGDSINNSAAIFFDFNDPVITNTVTTKIVEFDPLNISTLSYIPVEIFPIPANDYLNIKSEFTVQRVTVYNSNGVPVRVSQDSSINIHDLLPGIYYCLIDMEDGKRGTGVFVKM